MNKFKKPSPFKYWQLVAVAAQIAYSEFSARKRNKKAEDAEKKADERYKEEKLLLDAEMDQYRNLQFRNPYAENVMEDLTVSKEAAEFQMEQGAQQRANILQSLSAAAGSSGISSLAQSLANQGTLQARMVSSDIAKQEAINQRLLTQGNLNVQRGDAMVQNMELQRNRDLLMAAMGGAVGAKDYLSQMQRNTEMARQAGNQQRMQSYMQAGMTLATADWEKMGQDWSKLKDTLSSAGDSIGNWWANMYKGSSRNVGYQDTGMDNINAV